MARASAMFALVWLASGCAPEIGDACESSLDCSAQATRLCDLTQPSGYCTLPGCDQGTCPEEAVCVQFRPDTPRLSSTFCMLECEDPGDCRSEHGYTCLSGSAFGLEGQAEARVLDGNRSFCAQPATLDNASLDKDTDDDAPIADAGTDAGGA